MFTFKLRRDRSSNWVRINPILGDGEPGYERDTGRFKIGDGVHNWLELEYFYPGAIGLTQDDLLTHVNDPLPHTAYDDGPSLLLLYANAKV